MRALFDTRLVVWSAEGSRPLPREAREFYRDLSVEPTHTVARIWKVAVKSARRRPRFDPDPGVPRRGLLGADREERPVLAERATAVAALPLAPHDPFDRPLIARAGVETMTFPTADRDLAACGLPVRLA